MARKSKKLKISFDESSDNGNNQRVHFDKVDSTLAEEHYGYYLMSTLTKALNRNNASPRIYLSLKHKKEFYRAKVKSGYGSYNRKVFSAEHNVFDIHKDKIDFLRNAIEELFSELLDNAKTIFILRGLSLILALFDGEIEFDSIYDIETKHQNIAYKILSENNINTDVNKQILGRFFTELESINSDFERINSLEYSVGRSKGLKALPSSIVYQLEKHALIELKEIKLKIDEYHKWIGESSNIFTPENIAKTFIENVNTNGRHKNRYQLALVMLMKKYANLDMYILLSSTMLLGLEDKKIYFEKNEVINKLAIFGVNIDFKTVKMHILLHKELFPEYPYVKKFDKHYLNPDINIGQTRKWLSTYFNSTIDAVDERQYPLMNYMYPFVLLLMIRHGLNLEVLVDWKVKKNKNGAYEVVGDKVEMFTIIDAVKNRSNSEVTTVLRNDSLEKKYLNLYIKWATPIYEKSGDNTLFQYGNFCGGIKKEFHCLSSKFLTNVKNSKHSFYNKYEIIDLNDVKIKSIDHRKLRVSHNYQNFLQGKSEFERQLSKSHKSGETTKEHYENHAEWNDLRVHRIAIAQNLVVGIFKGEISREEHKTAMLINGPIADCKNNKSPTFNGAPMLKDNEMCSDWTKCLTQCDKSCVIPQIHGAVIYAWIDYMKIQKEDFIREVDWEKEYLLDYDAAKDTVSYFTKEEQQDAKKNAYRHAGFIQMKFPRIIKEKRLNDE